MHLLASASAVLAAFVLALGPSSAPQDPGAKPGHAAHQHGQGGQHTMADRGKATTIAQCMVTCEVCSHHCAMLAAEGKKEHGATHHLLSDCADVCGLSASFAGHGSAVAGIQLEACARVCDQCAAACEKFDDPMMKECAQSCRKCAEACRAGGASPGK